MPPVCADQGGLCDGIDLASLQSNVARELEFAGYSVIDAATLVNEARTRDTVGGELRVFGDRIAGGGIKQSGSLFEDLPPAARRQLLGEARADGIVRTRLTGLERGYWYSRVAELQLRLGIGPEEDMAWVTRCKFEGASLQAVGGPPVWTEAIPLAVKCATDEILATK